MGWWADTHCWSFSESRTAVATPNTVVFLRSIFVSTWVPRDQEAGLKLPRYNTMMFGDTPCFVYKCKFPHQNLKLDTTSHQSLQTTSWTSIRSDSSWANADSFSTTWRTWQHQWCWMFIPTSAKMLSIKQPGQLPKTSRSLEVEGHWSSLRHCTISVFLGNGTPQTMGFRLKMWPSCDDFGIPDAGNPQLPSFVLESPVFMSNTPHFWWFSQLCSMFSYRSSTPLTAF